MDHQALDLRIQEATKVFNKKPRSLAFALLANLLRQKKNYKQAIQVCKYGLNYHPKLAKAYTILGQIYYEQTSYKQAVESLQVACDLEPNSTLALKLLGQSHLHLGHLQKSLKAYEQLLLYNPGEEWVEEWIRKLNDMHSDKYSKFSTESIESISSYLQKKEFECLPVLRPHRSNSLNQNKQNYDDIILSLKDRQKTKATSIPKEDEKIKQLQDLLNKLSPPSNIYPSL